MNSSTTSTNEILMEIAPRLVSVGGPQVHRLMPYKSKRMVGPFIFFDYFPATDFAIDTGMNVRPHPHIGLSTLSYLLEGQVLHADSEGNHQLLNPGDVNWMTAGGGISHSERTPLEAMKAAHRLHLMQFWLALPLENEDRAPSFTHHPKSTIPQFKVGAADVILIAGSAMGRKSPVEVFSPLFFMDVKLKNGESFEFTPEPGHELAFYIVRGQLQLNNRLIPPDDFVVLQQDSALKVNAAADDTHFVVLGGEPFKEERFIYWNFVSSSRGKIEDAKHAWRDGSFPQVPGETDIVPLPE